MKLRSSASFVVALATASALLAPSLPAAAAPAALPSRPAAPRTVPTRINDVDGDGRVDVVMLDVGQGQYGDDQTEEEKAEDRIGGIRVLFADGKVQTVTRDHLGLPPFNDSRFGAALTVGDLNSDGYADIVVADSSDGGYGGVVWAIWGSAKGISRKGVSVLARGGLDGYPVGAALAFIPVPEPVLVVGLEAGSHDCGAVRLYAVTGSGRLGAHRDVTVGSPGIAGRCRDAWSFGRELAASNDLLVLGVPDAGPRDYGGAAWVMQLAPGLTYWATRITQETAGVPGRTDIEDSFGSSVSVLDDWVAIGIPGERVRGSKLRGAIQPIRIERTGTGLRIHPVKRMGPRDSRLPTGAANPEGIGWRVRVAQLCPGRVGAVVDAGPATVPFTLDATCPGMLLGTAGSTAFTLLRRGTGGTVIDQPAVVVGGTVVTGWPSATRELDTGPQPWHTMDLARPAA